MMPRSFKPNGTLKMVLGDWIPERARNGIFVVYYHRN